MPEALPRWSPLPTGVAPITPSVRRPFGAGLFALLVIGLVFCGSLSPYQFDLQLLHNGGWGLDAIGWPHSPLDDLVTNLMVYLPVGAALSLWLKRRMAVEWAVLAAAVIGGLVSLTAETLQTAIAIRSASWLDVIVNTAGALWGALAAPAVVEARVWALDRLRTRLAQRPLTTLSTLVTVGVVVVSLSPFDFVTNTGQLHASLAAARWSPLRVDVTADAVALGFGSLTDSGVLGTAGLFVVVGFLLALAARERGLARRNALEAGLGQVALLAVLIELLQLLRCSGGFGVLDAILYILTGFLGVLMALYAVDLPSNSRWRKRPGSLVDPVLLVPLVIGQLGYHLLEACLAGPSWRETTAAVWTWWLPFASVYGWSLFGAFAEMTSITLGAGLLAVTVALLARSLGRSGGGWLAVLSATTLAVLSEAVASVTAGHPLDATHPALAFIGAVALISVYVRVVPPRPVGWPAPSLPHPR